MEGTLQPRGYGRPSDLGPLGFEVGAPSGTEFREGIDGALREFVWVRAPKSSKYPMSGMPKVRLNRAATILGKQLYQRAAAAAPTSKGFAGKAAHSEVSGFQRATNARLAHEGSRGSCLYSASRSAKRKSRILSDVLMFRHIWAM